MNKSDELKELATALAKAQSELCNASKSSANPFFKSKYADLAEVINTVKPVFSSHGLSITQMPSFESGVVSVETLLLHSSGQWISSVVSAPVTKQDAQGVGSAITYCRRYALAAVAGIAQEDDDANSAVGRSPAKTAKLIDKVDAGNIRKALEDNGIDEAEFCHTARIDKVESLALDRLAGCLKHIKKEVAA